jgi:hypothetical protein
MELKLVFSGIGIELDGLIKNVPRNCQTMHWNSTEDQNIKRRTNAT